ncbi:methionine--tRNA ligase [Desulfobotulus sp.]|jgi:methionyl-tRNA synthetase|uniref:methionine--tRNA ligase n=1 Tax=Desulfobotulus sp. TaxID=1940337 RepID=UPI002A358609|nr:methionine--tRNA ligase [Desulfobotulus sp.]MDY0161824.1 methionine--tRNA ligase [Desulfobotulus sp.]
MSEAFYITTPIYYVNARPHLGHAYTTIAADVAARFARMQGKAAYFLTGTDEHGDKIVKAATKENKSPRTYADAISAEFRNLWPALSISNDQFIRTTDPAHIRVVQHLLQKIYDAGDIYFSEYEGLYCYGCERFYTEKELVDGKCPDHLTAPEKIQEANYFFRMSRYQEWLVDHIQKHPDFIRPERYRNEILAFLREPLEDLCISRPTSRLQWGIPLPFDARFVTYVWFDALTNYVSALGYPDHEAFQTFWPGAQHIVAKDIIKPHGIYWPTMLKAAGIPLYQHLHVHGYWNIAETKMSKSLGNVVDPLAMKNTYGVDAFRYFLMREMVFGLDASFSEEALVGRINADLANDIGNLFSRVIAMTHKYYGGKVPAPDVFQEPAMDFGLMAGAQEAVDHFIVEMQAFAFHKALMAVWAFISQLNKYIDTTAPWELQKHGQHPELDTVMYNLLEGLRIISGLISPVMPETAVKMQQHLGLSDPDFNSIDKLKTWGLLPTGHTLPKAVRLFPRIETKKEDTPPLSTPPVSAPPAKGLKEAKPPVSIEEVQRLDLRVATISAAERVPKSEKLLRLEVDLAGETRQVVAGIGQDYTPESLVGMQVILVANLKAAKLMGVRSEGMILAANGEQGLCLASFDKPLESGTVVR